MGVWGTSIFSGDDACDLRDDYCLLVGDGLSGPDATDRLVQKWTPSIEKDPDLAATFWLALAVTQWKCGRLADRLSLAVRRFHRFSSNRSSHGCPWGCPGLRNLRMARPGDSATERA